jgi:H+/Cl- antiporter ClcA
MRHWYHSRLALVLESTVIGFVAGFVVVVFRYLLGRADMLRQEIYEALPRLPLSRTLGWSAALVLVGLFLGWTAKKRPLIKGSGIPQIKGVLQGRMSLNWMPDLPLKMLTGLLGLGAGLSLGREGPSVQIGAYVGEGVLSFLPRPGRIRKFLIISASAAGISAAFNAPLAGVLFVLEELQAAPEGPAGQAAKGARGNIFSPLFLACAMGASMAADVVAGFFFGSRPVFDFRDLQLLSIKAIPWVILLGVICGFLGDLFKRLLYLSQNMYRRFRIPEPFWPVLPLLVSIPLGFFFYDLTGGGHGLIESLSRQERSLGMIGLLLGGKFLFTALCYGSGTSGGIFLPLLACGALTGQGLGMLLAGAGLSSGEESLNFMILGMAAFFTGVVKAPVTGILLILEMSGNFKHLGNLVLAALSALVTADLIASRPVYSVLLERMLAGQGKGRELPGPAGSAGSAGLTGSAGPAEPPHG